MTKQQLLDKLALEDTFGILLEVQEQTNAPSSIKNNADIKWYLVYFMEIGTTTTGEWPLAEFRNVGMYTWKEGTPQEQAFLDGGTLQARLDLS